MVDIALCIAEEALAQVAESLRDAGRDKKRARLAEIGQLAQALPVFATLCAPLANAMLAPQLDRATSCCKHLADITQVCSQGERCESLAPENINGLLDSLSA